MKATVKMLYTLASQLGMVWNDSEDDFHILVFGITGKQHVTQLTQSEMEEVRKELERKLEIQNHVPGMMTPAQKKLAWRLVYRLDELQPSEVRPAERLLGAVRKTLGTTLSKEDPFRWLTFNDGIQLIEQLKRYVKSAERKAKK